MRCLRDRLDWTTLVWWLAVLGAVLAIKHHYSIATAADLEWMLRPLSLLLEWISGHMFHLDSRGEWVSESADVRLVKACAGVNFLLMSLLAWAWILRPDRYQAADAWNRLGGRILLLLVVIVAAWVTGLLANALRIFVAMNLPAHGDALHRLVGMLVYVPLLSLQLHLGDRRSWKPSFGGPVVLYLLIMAIVPMLTGNAFERPGQFIEHLLYLAVMIGAMGGLCHVCIYVRCRHPARVISPRSSGSRSTSRLCQVEQSTSTKSA